MKKFYFDVETSGLEPVRNGIISLGYIIEIHGDIKAEGLLEMQPPKGIFLESKALAVNGYQIAQIETFEPEIVKIHSLCDLLLTFPVGRWDVVGYNISFDISFLKESFARSHVAHLFSMFNYKYMDIYALIRGLDHILNWHLPNHRLKTACDYLGIPLTAHNALDDIKATKRILEVLKGRLRYERS